MNVNGKERLSEATKPSRERMYLTYEAKGHEIPVALGNTVATGSSNSRGATNSFQRAWKSRSVQISREQGPPGRVRWYSFLRRVQNHERVLHEDLGARKLSTSLHMAVGGSREAVYASAVALHATPVVWVEVVVFTYWTSLLRGMIVPYANGP